MNENPPKPPSDDNEGKEPALPAVIETGAGNKNVEAHVTHVEEGKVQGSGDATEEIDDVRARLAAHSPKDAGSTPTQATSSTETVSGSAGTSSHGGHDGRFMRMFKIGRGIFGVLFGLFVDAVKGANEMAGGQKSGGSSKGSGHH
jgi:hypothetical protein